MENDIILKKTREYIASEQNTHFRNEVERLLSEEDFDELNDRFFTDLEFGTGGLRGVIGGGTNRMNPLVVHKATQGLANYIKQNAPHPEPSVVIAFDSRRYSETFAMGSARVLAGNGITAYLFEHLRPTPELSFAVRHLHATAGIVITASHNPPQYNGYKVYWTDGGQIIAPHDRGIIENARAVNAGKIQIVDEDEGKSRGLIKIIGDDVDTAFIESEKSLSLRPELLREHGSSLSVIYTPLHGTGGMPVARILGELGIQLTFVPEQKAPDGDFPTVRYPNPEEPEAMTQAIELAKEKKADLVMGTDPDADRIGIAVADNGSYRLITGNQLGALLTDYIFSTLAEQNRLPETPVFINTVVTTELQQKIARHYNAIPIKTLTGFKYIAAKIEEFERDGDGRTFIFGTEESYGYLIGTSVRDKDAVSAAMMTAEMTLYHRQQGVTLLDRLNALYRQFGYFKDIQISRYFEGQRGGQIMKQIMNELRTSPPSSLGEEKIESIRDYKNGTTCRVNDNSTEKDIDLPSADVLQFVCDKKSIVTVRPSGTEPKIKFYLSCRGHPGELLDTARKAVGERMNTLKKNIDSFIARFDQK
jgi:phosphoglucomutase